MTEQFANFAQSTLAAPISAKQTKITVANASTFPLLGNFRIVVQSFDITTNLPTSAPEIMLVTAVAGNVFTVTRAAESSTLFPAIAFAAGATVTNIITAGVMAGLGTGSVTGPATSVDGDVAIFSGTTGKIIKDTGIASANIPLTPSTNTFTANQIVHLSTSQWTTTIGDIDRTSDIGGHIAMDVSSSNSGNCVGIVCESRNSGDPAIACVSYNAGGTRLAYGFLGSRHTGEAFFQSTAGLPFSHEQGGGGQGSLCALNLILSGGVVNPTNTLDVVGQAAIGVDYAGVDGAPSNGLIIEGQTGIGTPSPFNLLDVAGGVVIGSGYAGSTTAPTDGLAVQGTINCATFTSPTGFTFTPTSTNKTVFVNASGSMIRFGHDAPASNSERVFQFTPQLDILEYFSLDVDSNAAMLINLRGAPYAAFCSSPSGTNQNFIYIYPTGRIGVRTTSPSASIHLPAGSTAAGSAPIKLTSGPVETSPEVGAIEFLTDKMFFTITTGTARKEFAMWDAAGTSGRVPFETTNGRLTDNSNFTYDGTSLSMPNIKLSSNISQYKGVNTTGQGVPSIYGTGRSTAQTAAVASVAAYTVGAADGSFYVSCNVNVTTSTAHSFTVTCAYTDETNTARTLTFSLSQLAGTIINTITNITGAGPYEGIPAHIRCKASTAITIATTGTFTTVTYNVEGTISQIS